MQNLGIDWKLLLAQTINFVLFFIIFKRFFAKPFIRFIDEEKNKSLEKEKVLQKAKKQEEEIQQKEEEFKKHIKQQTDQILAEAKKDAEKVKQEMLEKASAEVEELREKTKKQFEEERKALYSHAKEKVSELSFFIVNSALKDILTEEMRRKITEALLKNSSKQVLLNEN